MRKITIKNTQKNALWSEGTVTVPETIEEFRQIEEKITGKPATDAGILSLINHALPIKARSCKNVEELQEYINQIIAGQKSRSRSEKRELIARLEGSLAEELLEKMSIKQLKALCEALGK